MAEEVQPKPIATLITENVTETLSRVRIEQGGGVALIVERLNEENHEFNRPRHLLAIVDPGDPVKADNQAENEDEFTRDYVIHVWVMPSQTNGVPIDETMDQVIANITRALCADDGQSSPKIYTRGGLAIDTTALDPETIGPFPKSLAYLVNVSVQVRYTTRERDPYRKG